LYLVRVITARGIRWSAFDVTPSAILFAIMMDRADKSRGASRHIALHTRLCTCQWTRGVILDISLHKASLNARVRSIPSQALAPDPSEFMCMSSGLTYGVTSYVPVYVYNFIPHIFDHFSVPFVDRPSLPACVLAMKYKSPPSLSGCELCRMRYILPRRSTVSTRASRLATAEEQSTKDATVSCRYVPMATSIDFP
jgi:hypothetical protein